METDQSCSFRQLCMLGLSLQPYANLFIYIWIIHFALVWNIFGGKKTRLTT